MAWLEHDRYEAEFAAEMARLGAAVSASDPGAPVPTCPEWSIRDLVTHVGTGHRWAAGVVEERLAQPPPFTTVEAPRMPHEWQEWLIAGGRRLTEAIRHSGPERQVWTWQPGMAAGFWLRRMLHDGLVHRFDAELAAGRFGEVAPDLAADGVSDLLACLATLSLPAVRHPVIGGLVGAGETLHLRATDPGLGHAGEWLLERTPSGIGWRHGSGPADVTVRAPARELLLVLNRRLDPVTGDVRITGDGALFAHWLEHSRF